MRSRSTVEPKPDPYGAPICWKSGAAGMTSPHARRVPTAATPGTRASAAIWAGEGSPSSAMSAERLRSRKRASAELDRRAGRGRQIVNVPTIPTSTVTRSTLRVPPAELVHRHHPDRAHPTRFPLAPDRSEHRFDPGPRPVRKVGGTTAGAWYHPRHPGGEEHAVRAARPANRYRGHGDHPHETQATARAGRLFLAVALSAASSEAASRSPRRPARHPTTRRRRRRRRRSRRACWLRCSTRPTPRPRRVTIVMTTSGLGTDGDLTLTETGVIDLANRRGQLTLTSSVAGQSISAEMRIVDNTVYLDAGDGWVSQTSANAPATDPSTPANYLDYLQGVSSDARRRGPRRPARRQHDALRGDDRPPTARCTRIPDAAPARARASTHSTSSASPRCPRPSGSTMPVGSGRSR